MFKSTKDKLHSCIPCREAKVFTFSFEREATILGVGYFSQVGFGHGYAYIVGAIYMCLGIRPAVKAAREFKRNAQA